LRRIDRAAAALNPVLIVIAITLLALDAGCYLAVAVRGLAPPLPAAAELGSALPLSEIAVLRLPRS
jgi:hypothetical protein